MADRIDRELERFIAAWIDWVSSVSLADVRASQPAPWAGLGHGAAGTAYALWRVGTAAKHGEALVQARRWWSIAMAAARAPRGLRAGDLARMSVATSVVVGPPGIHAVGALVGQALGRARDRDRALAKFISATTKPRRPMSELWFGDAGVLATALGLRRHIDDARLDALIETVRGRVVAAPALPGPALAHGRAGVQRTLISSARATESAAIVPDLEPPNVELVRSRAPAGLGLSLCNGLAGFVLLWVSAFEATGDARWLDAAQTAAPALESDLAADYNGGNVCCGLGGRAYALLAIARIDPSGEWRPRARALALRSLGDETLGHGLYGGLSGLVCLVSDLTRKSIAEPLPPLA